VLARDADNLAFAMLVRSLSSSNARVMVRMLDTSYRSAYTLAGVRDVVAEADVVVGQMSAAIEFPQVTGSLPLGEGNTILFQLPIRPRSLAGGKTVAAMRADPQFPRECLFIGFLDPEGKITLPEGATVLRPGDTAIMVAHREQIPQAVACLTAEPVPKDPAERLVPALRALDFLSPLSHEELVTVARGVDTLRKKAGESVFAKGDTGDSFYLVLEGEVSLVREDGRVLETVRRGGFFGEIALLTGEPRSTGAKAAVDCELAAIGREDFRGLVMANPAVALEMSRILGQRLATAAKEPSPARPKGLFRRS
ncbi:MAG TPA: cyclic nucleotide-binding domain-containing protein, partial [Myxococcaceae bacterium]|nr:cyclic nucleotide-binding domain-containing protein [Myxococcaceae bacterium]